MHLRLIFSFSETYRLTYSFWLAILFMVAIAISGCRDNANRQFFDDAEKGNIEKGIQ